VDGEDDIAFAILGRASTLPATRGPTQTRDQIDSSQAIFALSVLHASRCPREGYPKWIHVKVNYPFEAQIVEATIKCKVVSASTILYS
jgi:hypothetical protein